MTARILALPYDVRYLIYQHIFPPGEQIYIQAHGNALQSILPEDGLPTDALLVCRQINEEASGYLYNNYLFNIVGTKKDCLASYETFLEPLRKHARHEVRIDAFSNGEHSSTMCISLRAGDAKDGVLNRRARGQHKSIGEVERELGIEQRQIASAATIPRQVVTVTDVTTHTIYALPAVISIATVYYTSTTFHYSPAASISASHASAVTASLNPINGLPVPPVSNLTRSSHLHTVTSHSTTSHSPSTETPTSASNIVITPLTFTTLNGTATLVPYTYHSASSRTSTETHSPPSSTQSSKEAPKPTSSASSSESSEAPKPTTSSHTKLTITVNLSPTLSHLSSSSGETSRITSTHSPSSTGDSQGIIGQ
ncbi:hypothetical protein LTR85_002055 [Meristemomyces frigidus]|nr:hypothetical protein LTR85_002055 [Meristemomyces frigidus]